jgi:HEPN domain-containing protein
VVEELGRAVPRTHNLDDVLNLLLPDYPALRSFRHVLIRLTRYAVDARYPGERTSKRQAASALRWVNKVRTAVRDLLDIRPPRKRRKRAP